MRVGNIILWDVQTGLSVPIYRGGGTRSSNAGAGHRKPREALFFVRGKADWPGRFNADLWPDYEAGTFKVWPACIRVGFKPGFAASNASSFTLYFRAMDVGVSPA